MSDVEPVPLSDERILAIVGEGLSELSEWRWTVEAGPRLVTSGSATVTVLPADDENFRHVDLELRLNGEIAETGLVDCVIGLADDPETAIRDAVGAWLESTAVVALELMDNRGRFAAHISPGDPEGFPGWHMIVGAVSGWGDASSKQEWFVRRFPWKDLAPTISSGLDREALNGVRLFVGQGGDYEVCEVKINGRVHEASSRALSAMDWPRTARMGTAKVYLLLVHPVDRPPVRIG